ncbi:aldo/keto reductase [Aquipuribacter nitratireducens]|uniref:Aldo/keto reductase n=1 Tax=Aquipuribacter nitratireducens TaxID=650104 RepID=A0ABW0GJP7_9MICO
MTYRRLGDSGLVVSTVGLGGNTFGARIDADATRDVVHAALDAGVTFVDCAELYGSTPGESEDLLGRALVGRRDGTVLATKFGHPDGRVDAPAWDDAHGSRTAVRRAVEGSLRRLRTDWIDLYQMHTPDPATPVEETLSTLDDLVREGKVRYVGSSNFAAWQVVDADRAAESLGTERFVSAQNAYNLLDRSAEAELVPACEHVGVGLLPYYPLASGLLTGKYSRGQAAPEGSRLSSPRMAARLEGADWDTIEALTRFAEERDLDLLTVALGGLAAQPAVGSVIAGARTPAQVRANVRAGLWEPTAADLAELEDISGRP